MPRRFLISRRLNWILAAILGLGLLVSIFASTFLPLGVAVGVCIAGVFFLSIADVVRHG